MRRPRDASDSADEVWRRRAERPILVLALVPLVLVVLVIPLLAGPPLTADSALAAANAVGWATFTLDSAARLYLARTRTRVVHSRPLDLLRTGAPALRPLGALGLLPLARLAVSARAVRRARSSPPITAAARILVSVAGLLLLAAAAYDDQRTREAGKSPGARTGRVNHGGRRRGVSFPRSAGSADRNAGTR